MHWSRWGDPAQAGPLSEGAFALVAAFIRTKATPAVDPASVRLSAVLGQELLDELAGIVGAEHVLTDHETRLHRTRGKSTPDMLKLRAGDGSDSPDAVVRPGTHDEVAALIAWAVERHVALVPFGGGTSVVGGLVARREGYAGVVSFVDGVAAMHTLAQAGVMRTVLRLYDENETSINLAKPAEVGGDSGGGCLMITGFEGTQEAVDAKRAAVTALLTGLGGASLGEDEGWSSGRFHGPYLRDSLLDVGVLVETLETVTFWSNLHRVYDAVKSALTSALGEGALVLCHISHIYETGASLYFTVAAKQADEPIAQWLAAKAAASDAMIDNGASITHHHAVGQDHKPWLAREIGPVGVRMLRALKQDLDPTGVLNPGVLIP